MTAKSHKPRRIPIDDQLYAIMENFLKERALRQPGKGQNTRDRAQTQARFSRDHVFVTSQNTPLTNRSALYRSFIRTCPAGIAYRNHDDAGDLLDHVDIHSLRRTFATDLIINGADPKTVQDLLGHSSLTMTMKIYAKVRGSTNARPWADCPTVPVPRPPPTSSIWRSKRTSVARMTPVRIQRSKRSDGKKLWRWYPDCDSGRRGFESRHSPFSRKAESASDKDFRLFPILPSATATPSPTSRPTRAAVFPPL